ncbi:phosphatase PAP2 family protein [Streptacidiphilus sp. PAMC 29251]
MRLRFWLAATAFTLLAALVTVVALRHGTPFGLDASVHRWALQRRTTGWTDAAIGVTTTGTGAPAYALAALAGAIATGSLAWCWRGALVGVVALALAEALRLSLATALSRPRPPRPDWAARAGGAAMPSGHATTSALIAVGLAAALLGHCRGRPARLAVCVLPALWAGSVGASRVYLGVHWPTDVLAGWLLAGALSCALLPPLAALLRRVGRDQPPVDPAAD